MSLHEYLLSSGRRYAGEEWPKLETFEPALPHVFFPAGKRLEKTIEIYGNFSTNDENNQKYFFFINEKKRELRNATILPNLRLFPTAHQTEELQLLQGQIESKRQEMTPKSEAIVSSFLTK